MSITTPTLSSSADPFLATFLDGNNRAGVVLTGDAGRSALANLVRVARFANEHDRPRDAVIVYLPEGAAVRIFSTDCHAPGLFTEAYDDVRTMDEARAVLGY